MVLLCSARPLMAVDKGGVDENGGVEKPAEWPTALGGTG